MNNITSEEDCKKSNQLTKGQKIAAIGIIINALINLIIYILFKEQNLTIVRIFIDISLSLYVLLANNKWLNIFRINLILGLTKPILFYVDSKDLTHTIIMILIYSICIMLVFGNPGKIKRIISISILSLIFYINCIGIIADYNGRTVEVPNNNNHEYIIPELSEDWEIKTDNDRYSLSFANDKYNANILVFHEKAGLADGVTHKDIVEIMKETASDEGKVSILSEIQDNYSSFQRTLLKFKVLVFKEEVIFYDSILTNNDNVIVLICNVDKDNYQYVEEDFELVISSFDLK